MTSKRDKFINSYILQIDENAMTMTMQ